MINYYKWKALISFMGERKRKKKHVGEKKEKKKKFVRTRTLALFQIQYTYHIGPQSVYVSRALCIIVFAELGQ